MTTRNVRLLQLCVVAAFFVSCTPNEFIKPNPPPSLSRPDSDSDTVQTAQNTVIDFGEAFDSIPLAETPVLIVNDSAVVPVPVKKVRVAVMRNVSRGAVYSAGDVLLRSANVKRPDPLRGRILFEALSNSVRVTTSSGKQEVVMPCTLVSESGYTFLDIDNATYRGAVVIIPGNRGTISFVNYLGVEEYLRGVVPLEMGYRPMEEVEALKAQAVAARTYTYRRIFERRDQPYDVVTTVADQVYGGASVENRESDFAIKATSDRIMTYNDSIVYAYYHSTCGGTTATIDEVWKKPHEPYLVSIADTNDNGNVYCAASTYFTWDEEWQWNSFTSIVQGNVKKMYPEQPITGPLTHVAIEEQLSCGRVKRALLTGKGWSCQLVGDEFRFVLRRPVSGTPILRSARCTLDHSGRVIRAHGKGYGHGIGMCQMGAIGRAQEGQLYTTILKAYYTGVTIATVKEIQP